VERREGNVRNPITISVISKKILTVTLPARLSRKTSITHGILRHSGLISKTGFNSKLKQKRTQAHFRKSGLFIQTGRYAQRPYLRTVSSRAKPGTFRAQSSLSTMPARRKTQLGPKTLRTKTSEGTAYRSNSGINSPGKPHRRK